jgi:hypothetical protein
LLAAIIPGGFLNVLNIIIKMLKKGSELAVGIRRYQEE